MRNFLSTLILCFCTIIGFGQAFSGTKAFTNLTTSGTVAIGSSSPNSKAALTVVSTTKGILPPVLTTTQRDAIESPTEGLFLYNTTTNALNVYTTSWQSLNSHPTDYSAPTNGATVTLTAGATNIVNPAGTIAGATLTLPTGATDGEYVEIIFTAFRKFLKTNL